MKRTYVTVGDFFDAVFNGGPGSYSASAVAQPPMKVTGTGCWPNSHKFYPQSSLKELDTLLDRIGTPWDVADTFPPFNVELNEKTGAVRFSFALSGIDPARVNVEFADGKMWLIIDKGEDVEKDTDWTLIKQKIKSSVHGKYYYEFDLERFNYKAAEAAWENGVLHITVPLNVDRKPHRITIKQ